MRFSETGPLRCGVLAWRDWPQGVEDQLEDLFYETYRRHVRISWTRHAGGGDFLEIIERSPLAADILIADREIVGQLALDGRVAPLVASKAEEKQLLMDYPEWLRSFGLRRASKLYGLPVRWGTTPILVKRGLKHHGVGALLRTADDFLFWSPHDYFLYTMAVLAAGIREDTPLVLSGSEFSLLQRELERISQRNAIVTFTVSEFIDQIRTCEAAVIPCAGEWVLEALREREPDTFARVVREYDYTFPLRGRVPAFFETVGVASTAQNPDVARKVAALLVKRSVRSQLESPTNLASEYGFYSNPTHGDPRVMGPGFSSVSAAELLGVCSPRDLPRDQLLRPVYAQWRESWREFVAETRRRRSLREV